MLLAKWALSLFLLHKREWQHLAVRLLRICTKTTMQCRPTAIQTETFDSSLEWRTCGDVESESGQRIHRGNGANLSLLKPGRMMEATTSFEAPRDESLGQLSVAHMASSRYAL